MRIFPATTIKEFSECEHGEFVQLRVRADTHSGLCIHEEGAKPEPKFLVLNSPDAKLIYKLIEPPQGDEVLAFGTNWTLSSYGEILRKHDAANTSGAFIQTQKGQFIVAQEFEDFGDTLLCRLDQPGVVSNLSTANTGFAFPYWQIDYFDETLSKLQKLAGNEPMSEDKG